MGSPLTVAPITVPINSRSHPGFPQPLETTHLLWVPMDCPVVNISYKWTTRDLLCPAPLPERRILRLVHVARIGPPSLSTAEWPSTAWVDPLCLPTRLLMDVGVAGCFPLGECG